MEHPREGDVIDVVALAADEPVVLDTAPTGPETADLDLVERSHSLTSWLGWGFILRAAHWTDLTMFW